MSMPPSLVLASSSMFALDLIKGGCARRQPGCMRALLDVYRGVGSACVCAVRIVHHAHSPVHECIVGALAGALPRPFFRSCTRGTVPVRAWSSFVVGVSLTMGNVIAGFAGGPLIAYRLRIRMRVGV